MIERIARALAVADGIEPDINICVGIPQMVRYGYIPSISYPAWTYYTSNAKAALEAMIEPTEKMIDAGECKFFDASNHEVGESYSAMIKAALND